ncbi:MAG: DUF4287 domain-containing protein [Acidobacteria bacterium]|nr:DUF4287 domain-containing protein [Acidobacteriota bacterium]
MRPIVYSSHGAQGMEKKLIENLPQKTGRTLDQWVEAVRKAGQNSEKEAVTWLKGEHGLGTVYATMVARHALGKMAEYEDPAALVDAMFSGPKAHLRPLSDALVSLALNLGDDVRACPGKTILPLYRNHVFAQVKPSSRTRVDLGLALRDLPAEGRLLDTGGFAKGDRISHRIPLSSAEEIDEEVAAWLRRAYALDA